MPFNGKRSENATRERKKQRTELSGEEKKNKIRMEGENKEANGEPKRGDKASPLIVSSR